MVKKCSIATFIFVMSHLPGHGIISKSLHLHPFLEPLYPDQHVSVLCQTGRLAYSTQENHGQGNMEHLRDRDSRIIRPVWCAFTLGDLPHFQYFILFSTGKISNTRDIKDERLSIMKWMSKPLERVIFSHDLIHALLGLSHASS